MSPRSYMSDSGPSHYVIGPIVAHALAFREQLRQHAPLLADSSGGFQPSTRPPRFFSAQVIERQVFADGSADLVAFADGRVRGVFADRVIAEVRPMRALIPSPPGHSRA